ncbi:tetratricopeptide repeat protein [bacterium]
MEILFENDLCKKPKISLILLDWSCRESFHVFDYLNNQTVPREEYEIIWIEYYKRRSNEIRGELNKVNEKGAYPILDKWVIMDMLDDVYYHKHLMYNVGIALAKGDIVGIGDSDGIFTPKFIESIISVYEQNSDVVLHYDEFRNTHRKFYPFNYPSIDEIIGEGCINYKDGKTTGVLDEHDPIHTRNYGAFMFAMRDDIIEIGGACEHIDYLGHVCGPYDITFRLVNKGKKELWHKGEFVYHVWHPGSDGQDNYLGPHDGRNISTLALKTIKSKRVEPKVENKAIKSLRKKEGLNEEKLLKLLIDEEKVNTYKIDDNKKAVSLGRIAFYSTDYDKALECWEKLSEDIIIKSTGLLADKGWALYFKGLPDDALNCFKKAIKVNSNDANAWRGIAWINYQKGNFKDAVKIFLNILNKIEDRNIQNVYRGLAWACFHLNDLDNALKYFLTALDNTNLHDRGSLQDICRGTGWIYFYKKNFNESKKYFNRALENIDSKDKDTYKDAVSGLRKIEECMEEKNNKKKGKLNINELNEVKDAWNSYLQGDFDNAIKRFLDILDSAEDKGSGLKDVYRGLAWAYFHKNILDDAMNYFKKSLDRTDIADKGSLQDIYRGIGWIHIKRDKFKTAKECFLQALDNIENKEGDIYSDISKALDIIEENMKKNIKDGTKDEEQTIDPVSLDLFNRAWGAYVKKDYKTSLEMFNDAIDMDSQNYRAFYGRGWLYLKYADFEKALKDFHKALKMSVEKTNHDKQEIYRGCAWVYYNLNEFDKALDSFNKALDHLDMTNKNALKNIRRGKSWAYFKIDNISLAVEELGNTFYGILKGRYICKLCIRIQTYISKIKNNIRKKMYSAV